MTNRHPCGLNLDAYQPRIDVFGKGVLSGEWKKLVELDDPLLQMPVVQAFLADDDLQAITVVSSCVGLIYTYQKRYVQ